MTRDTSRRQFVVTAGAAATLGLAGCTGGGEQEEDEPTDDPSNESGADGAENGSDGETGSGDGETESGDGDSETSDGSEPATVPDDASVSFAQPTGDEPASGGVSVVMEASNVDIEQSGEVNDGAGHFHVLVDTDPIPAGDVIPSDDQHVHFGDGSSETVLDLEPGDHELVLQVGDGQHRAFDLTDTVEVTVEEASASFVGIEDGDTVSSPVELEWETENYELESSGEVRQGAGHAHVLVDTDPVAVGDAIPSDDSHVHYGDGSASAEVELEPGEHTLALQMGNGHHLGTPLTDSVDVTVEE